MTTPRDPEVYVAIRYIQAVVVFIVLLTVACTSRETPQGTTTEEAEVLSGDVALDMLKREIELFIKDVNSTV